VTAGSRLSDRAAPEPVEGAPRLPRLFDLAYGQGTFVVGSYTAPVVRYAPSRVKHLMKMMMAYIYWLSLRGVFEPVFDWYFAFTAPEKFAARHAR